jgi:hypothetical protein
MTKQEIMEILNGKEIKNKYKMENRETVEKHIDLLLGKGKNEFRNVASVYVGYQDVASTCCGASQCGGLGLCIA